MKNEIIFKDSKTAYLVIKNNVYGEKLCTIDIEDIPRIRMFKWNISHITKRNKTHYVVSQIGGKTICLHRLIVSFPEKQIDHLDRNGLNNCKNNLREVTPSENCLNKKVQPNNKLGVKGIQKRTYSKGQIVYRARIRIHGKLINIGQSNTLEGAIKLRKEYETNIILSS
jgi:hypothetical protein